MDKWAFMDSMYDEYRTVGPFAGDIYSNGWPNIGPFVDLEGRRWHVHGYGFDQQQFVIWATPYGIQTDGAGCSLPRQAPPPYRLHMVESAEGWRHG